MKHVFAILVLMGISAPAFSVAQQIPAHQTTLLSPLPFTNRAQCAIDSEKPTSSIFVMIDGYNAAKVANSVAKLSGLDTAAYSAKAMKEFRLSVAYMTLNIMNKMVRGHLPVLPANLKSANLPKYLQVSRNCEQSKGNACADLQDYLSQLWYNAGNRAAITSIDRFTTANFPLHASKDRLGCYYVKKFSALQGHLHNAEVTASNLQDIALAYMNEADYITGCFDADDTLSNRFVTLQLDWATNPQSLEIQGFDFWNSLKIYMSWAWRNTNELEVMSPTFGKLFRSIALEEAVLYTPNGCRSMTPPSCDNQYLSINSLRELAKATGGNNSEFFDTVPAGTEAEMLEKGVRGVNNDFLGTQSFDKAEEWLSNFRKNLIQSRGIMKNKYQSAMTNMNLLQDQLGIQGLTASVSADIKNHGSTEQMMNELYYMCTEIRLAGDETLDFLKSDIERVAQLKNMTQMPYSEKRSLSEHVNYFKEVSARVLPVCNELEKTNFWNKTGYTVNKLGFAPWAKDMLQINAAGTEEQGTKFTPTAFNGTPLLSWKTHAGSSSASQVICYNSIDCTRLMIKSMVDLYAVSTYADALIPLAGKSSDPNLFNPYSELKTCKMYDPWYQTQRMNKVFMTDLANTALFGWNILPIYIDVDFKAPRVASFKQLVQDGTIKFDPRFEKSKIQTSIVADFGPLVGAPCALSLNNNGLRTFNFYAFSGITLNYCDGKQQTEVISNNPSDFATGKDNARSFCGGCTMNFMAVAGASTASLSVFNPAKFVVYMVRTFQKYFHAKKDKVNIPKSWNVNAAYAAEVYKKYGQIPSHCVDQLGKGLKCFSDTCAAKAASVFEETFNTKVHSVYIREDDRHPSHISANTQREAWIKSDLCKGESIVRFTCNERKVENTKVHSIRGFHKSCRNVIGDRR
ncbi:hypothetical protein AZI87_17570 [Bdellovibrio bacteriovorus]|uniref:Uncharacterized protein n=1 Tax=Bdellovibrio bacteriovorus TaxID=959 RepID=A0A161P9Q5_BDEBC|nr:hypothetical protein [Bdellovibrio bacteriovorus]KYG62332.1 hypothetical protein AZI87_17570 [Bdellovibrio bacteriovorus]